MPSTFSAILTAYLLVGFVLPEWKTETGSIRRLLLRSALAASISCVLLGAFHWRILSVIVLTYLLLGAIEARISSDSPKLFLAEQSAYLVVLFGLACYFPDAAKSGWWATGMKPDLAKWYFAALSCVSGIALCVPAGGVLISRLLRPFTHEIRESDITGLAQGGQYIGWLERILVMLLVLMDQPNGIGFLIAAKSILRFGEIKDANQRKVAEYIIIGTFLSFGWALLISVLTQKAVKYWIR